MGLVTRPTRFQGVPSVRPVGVYRAPAVVQHLVEADDVSDCASACSALCPSLPHRTVVKALTSDLLRPLDLLASPGEPSQNKFKYDPSAEIGHVRTPAPKAVEST
jgi:hypothetical protein